MYVRNHGTADLSDAELVRLITERFDLTPRGIIRYLDLCRPLYRQVAAYGHFGRIDVDVPWEKVESNSVLTDFATSVS